MGNEMKMHLIESDLDNTIFSHRVPPDAGLACLEIVQASSRTRLQQSRGILRSPFFTSRLHTQPPVIGSLLYNDTIDLAHLYVDFFVTGHNLVRSWSSLHGARLSAQRKQLPPTMSYVAV